MVENWQNNIKLLTTDFILRSIILLFLVTTSLSGFGQTDVTILDEINTINISGKKANSIIFSISKKIKFRVLTTEGVDRFSKFIIPETFDPTYISHFPKDRNYSNVYANIKCDFFRGTIKTNNGDLKDAEIVNSIEPVKMVLFYKNEYGNFEKYLYQIENLSVGDEVTIEYSYNVTYYDNIEKLSSFRVFFNNDIFKEQYRLSIAHHPDLNINIDFINDAIPDSIIKMENEIVYYWEKSNLSGCTNEDGSRPYRSLPHIIFSIKPYEISYTLPYSFEERYIPFYALFTYQREKNHLGIAKSISQGVNTKQYSQINKFINLEIQDIHNDTSGYLRLMKIHNTIADEFKFENDTDCFNRIDTRLPRMGDYLSKKSIRDISRYDLYVALILKLGLNYFTAYMCDKRTGEISDDFFKPMWDNDYIFAVVLMNNSIQYLYPKKSRFGFYLNELPFYFENTKARLICLDDYRNIKSPIEEKIRQITLPNSTIKENIRRTNVLVKINLDSLSVTFNAKINLFGQYSTLTRGLYLFNHKEENINEFYNKKIWESNDHANVISYTTNMTSKEYPFSAVVSAKYQFNNLLKANNDTITLNLKDWFNHIIYNDFDTTNRQLDFYPDFSGQDIYVYFLEFDKDITLLNSYKQTNIKNEFGEINISMEQVSPKALKLSSFFATTSVKVPRDKIHIVKEIYDRIEELNKSYLVFKVVK